MHSPRNMEAQQQGQQKIQRRQSTSSSGRSSPVESTTPTTTPSNTFVGNGFFKTRRNSPREETMSGRAILNGCPRLFSVLLGGILAVHVMIFCFNFLPIKPLLFKTSSSTSTGVRAASVHHSSAVSFVSSVNNNNNNNNDKDEKECSIWIAPSSVRGLDGYGVFTTRDMAAGESILGSPDGVGIPVEAQSRRTSEPRYEERRHFRNIWGNYLWARGKPDHVLYEGSDTDTQEFQTGVGSLPNHHCILAYLETKYPAPSYVDGLADRFTDPSAGSFSYSRGREFLVRESVTAGSEIFLNYGWCDRGSSKSAPDWAEHAFVTNDYEKAATLVLGYKFAKRGRGMYYNYAGKVVAPRGTSDHVTALLPRSKAELKKIMAGVGSKQELMQRIALNSLDQRTPEWIKEHGLCMDNLVANKSTIPLAGLGAFTQRTIEKGEMVVPAPLMQILDQDALVLYDNSSNPIGRQLLQNYCFQHTLSTMLLCPNTNSVLINHCSIRTKDCGPDGPNAEYRWASGWDAASDAWRNMTLAEIAQQSGRGLSFEIVALRDIQPNEEVTMDYGIEWETAWARHVATWHAPALPFRSTTTTTTISTATKHWITAQQANAEPVPILSEFVSGDLRKTTSHPYLFTGCQYWETVSDSDPVFYARGDWMNQTDAHILNRFARDGTVFGQGDRRNYENHRDGSYWPCTVIQQQHGINDNANSDLYTVRIHQAPWVHHSLPWQEHGLPRLLTNYNRSLIHYFVKPFESDQHLPGVFRHAIGIRDELFPEQWKNLKNMRT